MAGLQQKVKNFLVGLGPDNKLTQTALQLHARRAGFKVEFSDPTRIWIEKDKRRIALARRDLTFVPIMMEVMELFFDSIESKTVNGDEVLDFSQPAFHVYKSTGQGFFFPSIPEEDPLAQYTYWYTPKEGDILWDAGAYCGATTCMLAQMVGPTGKVYAFEPDDLNYAYLEKNIAHHGLTNVIPVRKALSDKSGVARFYMGGTMASGISDFVVYSDSKQMKEVPTISMEDACAELGCVPDFVKMDIEGAELALIRGAKEFLKQHPVNFAIESYHRVDGEYTYVKLDPLFAEIGYEYESHDRFKQMFTWARPKS
ncbi:MAG: FkbM family methyltransferase [Acidobacteriota bacterium]